MLAQVAKSLDHQQTLLCRSGGQVFVFQNPGIAVRHENCMEPSRERRIDVGLRTVSDHPGVVGPQRVLGNR